MQGYAMTQNDLITNLKHALAVQQKIRTAAETLVFEALERNASVLENCPTPLIYYTDGIGIAFEIFLTVEFENIPGNILPQIIIGHGDKGTAKDLRIGFYFGEAQKENVQETEFFQRLHIAAAGAAADKEVDINESYKGQKVILDDKPGEIAPYNPDQKKA